MEKKKSTPKSSLKKVKSVPKSARKSAAKEKASSPRKGEEKRGVYIYNKLEDFLKEEVDRVNVYATVLDCCAPYFLEGLKRYICTMKLIDDTVNPKIATGTNKPSFITLTVYGNTKSEVPQPSKMGSILRIHRGQTKKFNKGFQLNCDANIKAAWVLFDPVEGYAATHHTGRSYTFIEADKKRLKEIRKFSETFLKDYDVTKASSIGEKKGEVDMFCLVLNRKDKTKTDDQLLVTDGNDFFKFEIPHGRYDYVGPQEIVRVRGLTDGKGKLTFNDYTNIIKVDKNYSAAEELMKKIKNKKSDKEFKEKVDMHVPIYESSIVASEPLVTNAKSTTLKDLFSTDLGKLKNNKFKVSVNVLEIGPKDPSSWIVNLDNKARKQYNLSDSTTHYYKLQLFVQDMAADDHNIYPLYLCTIDGKGEEFISVTPAKSKKDAGKEKKELKRIYKTITKPWVKLDLILEGVSAAGAAPVFFIVDTKLTI